MSYRPEKSWWDRWKTLTGNQPSEQLHKSKRVNSSAQPEPNYRTIRGDAAKKESQSFRN